MLMLLIVCLLAKRFDDYVLYKVSNPSKQLAQELNKYDVWHADKSGIEVFMPKQHFNALVIPSTQYEVLKTDMQELIDVESQRLSRNKRFKKVAPIAPDDLWFEQFFVDYSPYDDVKAWYLKLSQTFPDLVQFVPSIGKSLEGRDLFAIHLTAPSSSFTRATTKKLFYFQSLIHAREWISGTTTAYIVWQFVKGFTNKDSKFVNILNEAEFVIVPIVNPDGYTYAHTTDRMWRKNTRVVNGQIAGVDLNRNFQDGHWGKGGSSTDPDDETYMGKAPFSEPETSVIDQYYRSLTNVVGAIDFHSYSQLILRPFGYTNADSPNEKDFLRVTTQMSNTIKKLTNKYYTAEKSIGLYVTTGTASDYFYNAKPQSPSQDWVFALTIELRPNSAFR